MARVVFTKHLERYLSCPVQNVDGRTVREALDAVFSGHPALRGYVLDDQSRVRKHVLVFHNGRLVSDRATLSDPLGPDDEILVLQALSGG